jgi:hypothetical protein
METFVYRPERYEPTPGSFNSLLNAAMADVYRAGHIVRDF